MQPSLRLTTLEPLEEPQAFGNVRHPFEASATLVDAARSKRRLGRSYRGEDERMADVVKKSHRERRDGYDQAFAAYVHSVYLPAPRVPRRADTLRRPWHRLQCPVLYGRAA